ncbi:hypothetical protein [Algiphilus sp.]|uniref:hypothetical protein n=1 Tax=Algiphilus sp. TaxID=1872431 RepID=UPI003B524235
MKQLADHEVTQGTPGAERTLTPAMGVWALGLALMVAMLAVLVSNGPIGWVAAAPLILFLPWLVRRSSYAHALMSLIIVGYIGIGLVFRDQGGLLVACLGAALFLSSTTYVRFAAVERRRAAARAAAHRAGEDAA